MTAKMLKALIILMAEALEPECHLAHLVVHDFNLGDAHIDFCVKYIEDNETDYIMSNPDATRERCFILCGFLLWLKLIPEDLRIEAMIVR